MRALRCACDLHYLLHSQKSQLQTVLITASGPQALNALVHRRRYTQGSRQNRCVSSQEALALRAKVKGNRGRQCPLVCSRLTHAVHGLALCALCRRLFGVCEGYFSGVRALCACSPLARCCPSLGGERLPTQNCLRRGIQLYN